MSYCVIRLTGTAKITLAILPTLKKAQNAMSKAKRLAPSNHFTIETR